MMLWSRTLALLIMVALLGLHLPASAQRSLKPFQARVVGITDGDTIRVLLVENTELKVRLGEIDAPESGQPYGRHSKRELSNLLFRKSVVVVPSTIDRYGRTVARVQVGGLDVSREMIRRGAAWVFIAYNRDPSLRAVEARARAARVGLWSLSPVEQVPPWEWRSGKRATARAVLPAFPTVRLPFTSGVPAKKSGPSCATKRFCSQMSTCDEAVYHLRVCGQRRLDGDNDGKPCERLCG